MSSEQDWQPKDGIVEYQGRRRDFPIVPGQAVVQMEAKLGPHEYRWAGNILISPALLEAWLETMKIAEKSAAERYEGIDGLLAFTDEWEAMMKEEEVE